MSASVLANASVSPRCIQPTLKIEADAVSKEATDVRQSSESLLPRLDFSWCNACSARERDGVEPIIMRKAPDFRLLDDFKDSDSTDDPEPEPEDADPEPSISDRYNGAHRHQPFPEHLVGRASTKNHGSAEMRARKYRSVPDIAAGVSSLFSFGSVSFCTGGDNYSRESSYCTSYWDPAFAWRFCQVWEDKGRAPLPPLVSPCIENEPLILVCAWKDRWWPLSARRDSKVGWQFPCGQGHSLELMHDYNDLFTVNAAKAGPDDLNQISFRSTDQGRCLQCIENKFCEWARFPGLPRPWERLQLRPALPGNYYCFHIYAATSLTNAVAGASSSALPICFDEVNACLVQCSPEPGCEPAVFALQTASSAHLLQEIIDLTHECYKQRNVIKGLSMLLNMQWIACKGSLEEASLQVQVSRRNVEAERLIHLEDNLDFLREQLQATLEDAGGEAAHGLPEACMQSYLTPPSSSRSYRFESPSDADSSFESTFSHWLLPDSARSPAVDAIPEDDKPEIEADPVIALGFWTSPKHGSQRSPAVDVIPEDDNPEIEADPVITLGFWTSPEHGSQRSPAVDDIPEDDHPEIEADPVIAIDFSTSGEHESQRSPAVDVISEDVSPEIEANPGIPAVDDNPETEIDRLTAIEEQT